MSKQTYWLNKDDADFVISAVERYDHVTQAEAERNSDPDADDAVYEITITRHGRVSGPNRHLVGEYPTLHAALSAEARSSRGSPT